MNTPLMEILKFLQRMLPVVSHQSSCRLELLQKIYSAFIITSDKIWTSVYAVQHFFSWRISLPLFLWMLFGNEIIQVQGTVSGKDNHDFSAVCRILVYHFCKSWLNFHKPKPPWNFRPLKFEKILMADHVTNFTQVMSQIYTNLIQNCITGHLHYDGGCYLPFPYKQVSTMVSQRS